MYLRQLQTFAAVYRTGSMVQAARQLFISQPAVSQQIKKLEDELGVELFTHSKGRVTPTENAELFSPYAVRAVVALSAGRDALQRHAEESSAFTVHVYFSNVHTPLTRFAAQFIREHPDLTVKLRRSMPPQRFHSSTSFDTRSLYFADAHWIEGTGLHFFKLYDAHLLCLMPPDSPLASHPSLGPGDLAGEVVYFPATPNATLHNEFDALMSIIPPEIKSCPARHLNRS